MCFVLVVNFFIFFFGFIESKVFYSVNTGWMRTLLACRWILKPSDRLCKNARDDSSKTPHSSFPTYSGLLSLLMELNSNSTWLGLNLDFNSFLLETLD